MPVGFPVINYILKMEYTEFIRPCQTGKMLEWPFFENERWFIQKFPLKPSSIAAIRKNWEIIKNNTICPFLLKSKSVAPEPDGKVSFNPFE
ncbi:MAG: hypothetical protein ACLFRG_15975, partial [Desulfococcaceae bacterium]